MTAMSSQPAFDRRARHDRRVQEIALAEGQEERRRNPERRRPQVEHIDFDEDIRVMSKTEAIVLALTGHREIDEQHARLVQCLDELQEHVGGRYDFAASLNALTVLFDYTREHFAFEEELLARWQYPRLSEHVAEHQAIIADLVAIWKDAESGHEVGERLLSTIRQWVIDHINGEDAQFAEYSAIAG